ncbi:BnaUnng00660D [Brassica napus]|uniref:BnaUnng00660D protein n=1 Tax=Brassica napus TaxID=3708 RepID=A0A078J8V8_BRANA|nr:BnaUnng00660D [Brassica napus]
MTATVLDNVTQKQMLKFLRLQLSCSIHVLKLDGYVRLLLALFPTSIVGELRSRELLHLHPTRLCCIWIQN